MERLATTLLVCVLVAATYGVVASQLLGIINHALASLPH